MGFTLKRKTTNIILWISAFIVVTLILWNTNSFFEIFKEEERRKVEIWANAQQELLNLSVEDDPSFLLTVLQKNTSTPMILVVQDVGLKAHNIDERIAKDSAQLQKLVQKFASENDPIQIIDNGDLLQTLYYGNSEVLNKLKYYPIALLLIILLFGTVIYYMLKSNKVSEQNKVWAGMAKETAHQIGTPLTSLLGWNEILKSENIDPDIPIEIAKDIARLQTITERFSKIGSIPELGKHDIVTETQNAFEYLKRRSSKLVQFEFKAPNEQITVLINTPLYNWSIENLVKNGIDAMKGKGIITVEIVRKEGIVNVQVSDTGHGIAKRDFQNVFNPGFTTKKRGWGLGLSLVKRIVEEYHKGRIRVLSSGKDGTIMQISLKIHQD